MTTNAIRAGVVTFCGYDHGPWNVHAFGLCEFVASAFDGTLMH